MVLENVNTNQISSIRNTLYSMASNAGVAGKTNTGDTLNASLTNNAQLESKLEQPTQQEMIKQELKLRSEDLNKKMKYTGTNIHFSYNDDIDSLVVTVREADGGKVIREIPSQEAIALTKKMHEIVGLIFDERG